MTFRSTVKGLSRVIVDGEDLSASIEKRDHVQILSGTAAVLRDRRKGLKRMTDTGISARGVVGRLPFASALFSPTKTIDIGGKGSFAMDPAKNFSWCKPYQLAFAEPRDACGALRNEKDVFNKSLLYIEGHAVL